MLSQICRNSVSIVSRFLPSDAGGGRNSASGKEYVSNQASEKGVAISSSPTTQEIKNKEATVAG